MKKNIHRFLKLFLILIFISFIVIAFLKFSYDNALKKPNSTETGKIVFEIEDGQSVDQILNTLVTKDLLQKKYYYYAKFYIKINNLGTRLQAGIYELPKQLNLVELIDSLQTGKDQDTWILITEGLRKDEIAKIVEEELSEAGNTTFSGTDFLSLTEDLSFIDSLGLTVETDNLEGFLFPDKYLFSKDITTEEVLKKLIETFKEKVGSNYTYQDIVLASIVEREGYNGTDRPIIAGIILKRFEEGWLLQTDATLLYPVKDWKHTITIQDKNSDNPYNTYKKIGLPPTPICNPGLQSIQAVWNAEETNYYYYIHDNDGNPHYGETLEQHNLNVNKYLR